MQGLNLEVLEFIKAHVPTEDLLEHEPMSRHTTFRIGGEAVCFIRISSSRQLAVLIPFFKKLELPYFILGNGSNVLVGDQGYDGVILQLADSFDRIEIQGNRLYAQAGALMSRAARLAAEQGLSGLAFASGIPGTIGGGVMMNAGAYGGEMKQVVERVTVLSEDGEILTLSNEDMEFGYRTSVIRNRAFVILEAVFCLKEGNKEEIKARMEELARKRREKQPLTFASAGSTFKRPEGYFAGKLIMDAGLSGFGIGGAKVSEKHCGFVVNTGNATAKEVSQVIQTVQETVKDKFGISLEKEIIYLGDF